ncbi:G protein-coupled glucose receptor regulating Gpa2-domain-containing protein, partial [Podospora australis]
MATSGDRFPLAAESNDLTPLPAAHRQGLAAVTVFAGLSFISSTAVLLYLTGKIVKWHIRIRKQNRRKPAREPTPSPIDLSLGLSQRHFTRFCPHARAQRQAGRHIPKKTHPNQFLVLIYNLLLADIHQAGAFLLNAVWVGRNGIVVRTPACWAQGWLVSTGDLSSSCFITAIAVHTYLAVVRNYTPPQWAVYVTVVGLWVFNYLLAILGVAITRNGQGVGGLYVRAAAWCWMNIKYESYRLTLHYLWIFISLALTSILYILIFISIRKQQPSSNNTNHFESTPFKGHHKAFLLYPVIYVICTAPLALGRIATMAGVDVSITYFCIAGALIASNGWLDVLLWGITRHHLIFRGDVDSEESGLNTFTFMRTPAGRTYGNMVWVEGCSAAAQQQARTSGQQPRDTERPSFSTHPPKKEAKEAYDSMMMNGWGKRRTGWRPLLGRQAGGRKTTSQESLGRPTGGAGEYRHEGMGIQMDMVTTVVVERA